MDTPSKRKGAELASGTDAAPEKKSKVPIQELKQVSGDIDDFSPALLRMYYSRLFPYTDMYKWMCYGNDEKLHPQYADVIDKKFFLKRELSFTLKGDIYFRYLSFNDASEMKKAMMSKQPIKIDLGAYYNASPKDKGSVRNFQPTMRELVFDIDLTDYDPIRTSASGADITLRCWKFMTVAVKIINERLRKDFGFKHLFWVYSGRRGVHCWVCDKRALKLEDSARAAIAEYLSVLKGTEMADFRGAMHPLLRETYPILEDVFLNDTIQEHGQALLSDSSHWHRVLQFVPEDDDLHSDVTSRWRKCDSPIARWNAFKQLIARRLKATHKIELKRQLENLPEKIIFTCVYPRLDVNVSTHRNHLLKSPFCVHPKTGRVCVPLDPDFAEAFNPFEVPTLAHLAMQLNEYVELCGHGRCLAYVSSRGLCCCFLCAQV